MEKLDNMREEQERIDSFDDMDIDMDLLRAVYAYGFEMPSVIQQSAIMPIINGKDVIAQAQSGTGKTGAFLISSMSIIDKRLHEPQVLILAPTRELAVQIYTNANSFNTYSKYKISSLIGGNDQSFAKGEQQTGKKHKSDNISFDEDSQMIVGTPGKVYHMLMKRYLKTTSLKLFILDEADEMLNPCFKEQIYDIFQYIPRTTQVCIFSATMDKIDLDVAERFMNDPIKILVKDDELTLDGIQQYYINVEEEQFKFEVLMDLYKFLSVNQTIIYCNTKKKTQQIHHRLERNDFTVSCIHGDMTQQERNAVIKEFRHGQIKILLATDIIARGLDVQQVSTVINLDMPTKDLVKTYIHRIGRSGRFGRKGMAINFVTKNEFPYVLRQIEQHYHTNIESFPNPNDL